MTRTSVTLAAVVCGVLLALPVEQASAGSKKPADPIAELRTAIEKDVADPARSAAMSSAVDELGRTIEEVVALKARQRETIMPLLLDYGATRESVEAKLAELAGEKAALAKRLLDAHVAFKAAATPAEWKKLQKLEDAALQSAVQKALTSPAESPKGE